MADTDKTEGDAVGTTTGAELAQADGTESAPAGETRADRASPSPAEPTPPGGTADILANVRVNASRFRWLGIVLIVAGTLCILFPLLASITAKVLVGWLFLLSGGVTLWHGFQARSWRSAAWNVLIGILQLAVGVYLAFFPLTGLIGLTAFLAAVFLVQGAFEIAMALQHRQRKGFGWLIASGAASVLLGLLLFLGLPGTAAWAIGLMVGINFLTSGFSFLGLVSAANRDA